VTSTKTGIPQKFVIKTKASFADESEKTVTAKPGSYRPMMRPVTRCFYQRSF